MRIRADEIPDSGRFLHFHWDEDRLNAFLPPEDPFALKLVRPVNVDLQIYRRTDHIRIQGTIEGVLQLACHRCLKSFQWPLSEAVDVFLVEGERPLEEEEAEPEADEPDYDFFDGEIIEIDYLVAEQIFLALPYKVLCSENCKGLCQRCGANLNDEPCTCEKDGKDSIFAKLQALRDRLPGAGDN
ncbi:MAG: DUF177 domain-containing protein [Syntrophobacteraceae bacterium]